MCGEGGCGEGEGGGGGWGGRGRGGREGGGRKGGGKKGREALDPKRLCSHNHEKLLSFLFKPKKLLKLCQKPIQLLL